MNAWKYSLIFASLMSVSPLLSEAKSKGCVGGDYKFGRAPKGCNFSSVGNVNYVHSRYEKLIFDERNNFKSETPRYVQNLYAVIRDAADFYIEQRKSNVSKQEKEAWRHAVFALVHQESFWTHFRISQKDEKLKLMHGDGGNGLGLMQIDIRWHKKTTLKEADAHYLMGNLTYGLEYYYKAWKIAAKNKKCVKTLKDQARSAYALYNGGLASNACRFSIKNHQNDKGYLQKYNDQLWNEHVKDKAAKSPLDVACMIETGGACMESSEEKKADEAVAETAEPAVASDVLEATEIPVPKMKPIRPKARPFNSVIKTSIRPVARPEKILVKESEPPVDEIGELITKIEAKK